MRKAIVFGAVLAAAAGAAFWAARDAGETGSIGDLSNGVDSSRGELAAFAPTRAQKEFRSMAVAADLPACRTPQPPKALSSKAYIRNSYAAILEILAVQRWQSTGSCACFFDDISWEEVVRKAPAFERIDGVALRFDLPKLREQADDLIAQRLASCGA
ncbi:hypothetical protein [Leisingera sp. ANG-M1]|uniref:hypothetical protein n=1 Tax=Leisingera sp. ANG-M1 TaxID=1577895 RepID=UPI0006904769|nr:hypothetical protein [Leisingera sp. ANG-M1]